MPSLPAFKNRRLPAAKRVEDLLRRMTTAEKIAQLQAVYSIDSRMLKNSATGELDPIGLKEFCARGIGRISAPYHGIRPDISARISNALRSGLRRWTRLGIPVLIDSEALHGCKGPGSTIFPQAIGLAAMWNPRLLETIGIAIGRECRSRGIHQVLSPVLDVARDVRAGRTEETYGEDPYLVSRLGVAFIRGVQSQRVITTPKHFVANFVGDGGRDSYPIHFSERHLREIYLPPYEAAFREAGALSVMTAYHSLDGVPCTSHRWLLTDLLRREWGFQGTVVSDWGATHMIQGYHHTAASMAEAAAQALQAGLDVELSASRCFNLLPDLAESGKLSRRVLTEAVRRVLYVKFWNGMFDQPALSPQRAVAINNHPAHQRLAREAARQSITLLKNDGLLPLRRRLKRVAIIGPNAAVARFGGYSAPADSVVTPLDGIRRWLGASRVLYAAGCPLKEKDRSGFTAARAAARRADAVIMIMGNSAPETEGENQDRCCLDLPGVQEDLILEVARVNPRLVVVLIGGSAVTMLRWIDKARAIVQAWYPGQEGAAALAEILFGLVAPGGKLPITFPKTTGQCPLYYNPKPSGRKYDYNDLRGVQAQFPFGHGLSYTTFDYRDLRVKATGRGRALSLDVSAVIRNAGRRPGDEVVQLYIRDEFSRRSRPLMELKGFQRMSLKPGERKTVRFSLGWRELAYLGDDLKPALEPGNLIVMLGSSSGDIRLKAATLEDVRECVDYRVSSLQPALPDIRRTGWPRKRLVFKPARIYMSGACRVADCRPVHKGRDGLVYIQSGIAMPSAGRGTLAFGADGPVKVWVNGQPVDCQPAATNPLSPPRFNVAVHWKKGWNPVGFALHTQRGLAWGVTAQGRVGRGA